MKNFKFIKSGFCEKLKLLLIPIGLLIGSLTSQAWAWYTINNANILYDDSKSGWNSNVVIALEKWENWSNNDGHGCSVFSMGQVANTKVWRWYGSWGDGGVNVIRFGSTTSTYDWYAWWSNDGGTVDDSQDLAERDKWSGYSGTWGGSISSAAKMFGANSSSKGAALTKTDLSSYADLNNITITVKAKVSTNNGKTYLETTSPATLSASSYKFNSYTTCNTASSLSNGKITCGYTATTTLTAPTTDPAGYKFEGWYNSSGTRETTNKTLTINPNSNATYYAYYRKLFKINAGATVVWDLGEKKNGSTAINWSNAYLRQDIYGGSQPHDALTHLGSGSQWSRTYASASSYMNAFMFRARNDGTWNGLEQTTDITTDVSNVTILTYKNTVTNEDSKDKLDWEVVTDGKKGASGRTVYFDDTNTNWGSGKMFFNYGVDYTSSGGFHRKIDFAATKVPGTENLWKLKASLSDATNQGATNSSGQLSHDIYFQKWYVSKSYGYTNHNPITDSHVLERTEIYTDEIVSNDFTLIPTTKKSGGSGTDGSPYIWNTTKMTGYKHTVTIGSHTNGTITLHYTDENGTAQNPTVTTDVAHTCIVNATATANNGYDYTSMTKGGAAYTPGTSHIVRADVTFEATFTAHTYNITLNAGDHGEANGSASVVFNTSSLASVTHVSANAGYELIGYYDGSTKVLNANGSFAADNVTGYITGGKWSKYDADATLTAKFSPVELTFKSDASTTAWGTASNWNPACVPTIEHDIIIKSPVVVNVTTAKAKSVIIYNDGEDNTGKLTIGAGNALVVAEDIQKTTDGITYGQTTADVLHIEAGSTSVANGALVWGTSGTPGAAQVDFFTKSHGVKNSDESINQYIGTPFSNEQSILYQYYYSWIFEIERDDYGQLNWKLMGGDESMNEFEGYNLITAYTANTTYQMEGTLVSNDNVTLDGSSTPALVYSGSGGAGDANNENVLANSWVAPIKIKALSGFTNVAGAVYIFNAGSEKQSASASEGAPGNYTTYSISTAGESDVIPSMQSFSVYTTGSSPVITLNYNTIVKSPLSSAYNNSANKAPARDWANEMQLVKVRIDGKNGWADELKIYIHEDFSNAFEDSWDAHKMYGYPEAPQLYAVTTDGNMAINCVPTADNNVLGFTPGSEDNEYTFSFTYDGDEEYYLKDTKLNIETLINTEATYTFTSEAEDSDMRFIIIKRAPAVATDAETVSGDWLAVSGVQKIMHNGQLYIIRDGGIYDATGTMVK